MKNTFIISSILIISVVLLSSFNVDKNENYSLTIIVKNLHNSKGNVQFALYNKDGSIPDEHYNKYFRISKGKITNKSSFVTFENIPQGKYAVSILHDENSNGKIDKGLILPKEGIGFSNIQTIGLSNRPNFGKASFDLTSNLKIMISIIYL
jgi:uncharacterized protein (DUF2141 family)